MHKTPNLGIALAFGLFVSHVIGSSILADSWSQEFKAASEAASKALREHILRDTGASEIVARPLLTESAFFGIGSISHLEMEDAQQSRSAVQWFTRHGDGLGVHWSQLIAAPSRLAPKFIEPFTIDGPATLLLREARHLTMSMPHDVDVGTVREVQLAQDTAVASIGQSGFTLQHPIKASFSFPLKDSESVRLSTGTSPVFVLDNPEKIRAIGERIKVKRIGAGEVKLKPYVSKEVAVRRDNALGLASLVQVASERVNTAQQSTKRIKVRRILQAASRTVEWYAFRLIFDVVKERGEEVLALDVTMAKNEGGVFELVDVQPTQVEATLTIAEAVQTGNRTSASDFIVDFNDVAMSVDTEF
mmetsp:Transcript_64591/g.152789  ORF Transcript_64591/g.152789 Transcript_64591/m.152789 type:complete len:360 (-) Transcript_64591:35-1114(-)